MCEEVEGSKSYSGGQESDWTGRLTSDILLFNLSRALDFGRQRNQANRTDVSRKQQRSTGGAGLFGRRRKEQDGEHLRRKLRN